MIKKSITDFFQNELKIADVVLLTPKKSSRGDYAINTYSLSNKNWKEIVKKLQNHPLIGDINVENAFINIFVSNDALLSELWSILKRKYRFGLEQNKDPQRINFEFGQPNTHKLPHVGHLFSYCYGESCVRLLEATGNQLFRANYQGDVGPHVAKCLYQVNKKYEQTKKLKTLEEKVIFLQKSYQEGSKMYSEDKTIKKEIDELNKKIYKRDSSILPLWKETRKWSLDYYKKFEQKLGIKYDHYFFESETAPIGKKIILDHVDDIFEESDGAIVFRGEKYGLHTRVFVNQLGNPTYEAKDVGLISLKQKESSFDKAILTTAVEQNAYYQVVKKSIELIFPELKGKINHIGFGMIDLKGGKMSSRTGQIVSAIELVKDVEKQVYKLVHRDDKSSHQIDQVVETVALSAIKYSFLKSEAKKNISFDIDESVSLVGNSGPYLQYTYARTQGVLMKSKLGNNFAKSPPKLNQFQPTELNLLRNLPLFPNTVKEASSRYAPHLICAYLYNLAQLYSRFYESCPILKAEKEVKDFRLALTAATGITLKNGLQLLGIDVLDRI